MNTKLKSFLKWCFPSLFSNKIIIPKIPIEIDCKNFMRRNVLGIFFVKILDQNLSDVKVLVIGGDEHEYELQILKLLKISYTVSYLNEDNPDFTPASLEKAKSEAELILKEVPKFLDVTFPEWEVVDAEHQLYEAVDNHPHAFKGFIDGVIKAKGKRGETIYWILDWKTTARGWFREKRSDDMVKEIGRAHV